MRTKHMHTLRRSTHAYPHDPFEMVQPKVSLLEKDISGQCGDRSKGNGMTAMAHHSQPLPAQPSSSALESDNNAPLHISLIALDKQCACVSIAGAAALLFLLQLLSLTTSVTSSSPTFTHSLSFLLSEGDYVIEWRCTLTSCN